MHIHHAIASGLRAGHILHSQHRPWSCRIGFHHLTQHRWATLTDPPNHQIIGQQNRKRLVADQTLGTQHRVTQSKGLGCRM